MPLSMARIGELNEIVKINGKDEVRRFLKNLGFVPGEMIRIVSTLSGNVILQIKNSRIAIDREMANRIIIRGVEQE